MKTVFHLRAPVWHACDWNPEEGFSEPRMFAWLLEGTNSCPLIYLTMKMHFPGEKRQMVFLG